MDNDFYNDFPGDYVAGPNNIYGNYEIFARSGEGDASRVVPDYANTFLRGIAAFVSRIGFLMIQVGSIPVENIRLILLYNVVEIVLAIISYSLTGYMFSYGTSSAAGFIGYNSPITNFSDVDNAVVGFAACLVGTAQMSTFLVGRIHLIGAVVVIFLYCSFYLPLLMHWIWHEEGWMAKSNLLDERVAIKDHAGDLVVHISSAIIGLMGAIFLGRRLVRMRNMDDLSMASNMVVGTLIGYFLIITGYLLFGLPTTQYQSLRVPNNYSGIVVANSIVALASGAAIVIVLHLIIFQQFFKYWMIIRCVQGGVAGLISVAAGVDVYTPLVAAFIAIFGGIFFFFFAVLIHNTAIEDCCNITSSHLVCGFLGTLVCPLLARNENLGETAKSGSVHFLWQFICLIIIIFITIIFAMLIFIILHYSDVLRNKYEKVDHRMAVVVEYNLTKRGFLERLFMIDDETPHIEPGMYRDKSVVHIDRDKHGQKACHKTLKFAR